MKKVLYIFMILYFISIFFLFSDTDYFIPLEEGNGIFMKWDNDWYEGQYLSKTGFYSIFGVLYALITNQSINGYRYIIIEKYDFLENSDYSYILVNTIPDYTIYYNLFNNNNNIKYKITFSKQLPNNSSNEIISHEIVIADVCGDIAWKIVCGIF